MKSERLKKIEIELQDLKQWLKLGLVPKKDIEKHKKEIEAIEKKLEEEKERLRLLKESGDVEKFSIPKRNPQARQAYHDPHTMTGLEVDGGENSEMTEMGLELDTEVTYYDTSSNTLSEQDTNENTSFDDDDDPFSDRNRWRRGILEDPESDSW